MGRDSWEGAAWLTMPASGGGTAVGRSAFAGARTVEAQNVR